MSSRVGKEGDNKGGTRSLGDQESCDPSRDLWRFWSLETFHSSHIFELMEYRMKYSAWKRNKETEGKSMNEATYSSMTLIALFSISKIQNGEQYKKDISININKRNEDTD